MTDPVNANGTAPLQAESATPSELSGLNARTARRQKLLLGSLGGVWVRTVLGIQGEWVPTLKGCQPTPNDRVDTFNKRLPRIRRLRRALGCLRGAFGKVCTCLYNNRV